MPAYYRATIADFVGSDPRKVVGDLQAAYARDGYKSLYTTQTESWDFAIPELQDALQDAIEQRPSAREWGILLEYPLYRLRRRIDVVILAPGLIIVIEIKVGSDRFDAAARQQAEEYALDLRDFHQASKGRRLAPALWCTNASTRHPAPLPLSMVVEPVREIGREGLASLVGSIEIDKDGHIDVAAWDSSPYEPVPSIIQAATTIFGGHDVRAVTQASAENLSTASARLIELVSAARTQGKKALLFLTGVPGSGKTLAGLQVVHDAATTGEESRGDIVYLSGNTPLVTVLREALARDASERARLRGPRQSLDSFRRDMRARLQHINDYLQEYVRPNGDSKAPHEHVIVFDEAQRAWDAEQGQKKFNRAASEPELLLELMGRHPSWCALICLVGGGQEINSGEEGVAGWGNALRNLNASIRQDWFVAAPPDVVNGGPSTGGLALGVMPPDIPVLVDPHLQLRVPVRSFRSTRVSDWVDAVLDGDANRARELAGEADKYPIWLTRSLANTRQWLRASTRGDRRAGLVASSGARRLRADGLGTQLSATDGIQIAHWYLNPRGDIRSSYALEVPANEYTSQGLELDFMGVCWGGDLVRNLDQTDWTYRRLNGPKWQFVSASNRQRYVHNSYRVLLTRAREGMVIWVPVGNPEDDTRRPEELDRTAQFLALCGARPLPQA